MIDIQFIEFYIKKKYNQNMCEYFMVSKPVKYTYQKINIENHNVSTIHRGKESYK